MRILRTLRTSRTGAIDDDRAALHHPAYLVDDDVDVRERVAVDGDQIRVIAGRDRAEVPPMPKQRAV